jgi:hypothetical protein
LVGGAEQDLLDVYPVGLDEGPEDLPGYVLRIKELNVRDSFGPPTGPTTTFSTT